MEKLSKLLSKLIIGGVILTIAILCFIVNGKNQAGLDAFEAISVVIGVTLIVIASLALFATIFLKKRVLTPESAGAASLLAVGIFFVCNKMIGGDILYYLVEYVPYELTVVGCVIIADAVVLIVRAAKAKTGGYELVIGEAVIGGITLLLGILALTVDGIKENKFLILGVILLIYSIFVILEGLFSFLTTKRTYVNVTMKNVDDSVIDAEVVEPKEEDAE